MGELAKTIDGQRRIAVTKERLDRATFAASNPGQQQDLPQGEIGEVVVESPAVVDTPPSFVPIPTADRVIDVNLETDIGVQARRGPAHDGKVRVIDVDSPVPKTPTPARTL